MCQLVLVLLHLTQLLVENLQLHYSNCQIVLIVQVQYPERNMHLIKQYVYMV